MTALEVHTAAILACLTQKPRRFGEIEKQIGTSGSYLREILRYMLANNMISRVEVKNRVWVYYPGQTAPQNMLGQMPKREKPAKADSRMYRGPIRSVQFAANSPLSGGAVARVSLPAEPWGL